MAIYKIKRFSKQKEFGLREDLVKRLEESLNKDKRNYRESIVSVNNMNRLQDSKLDKAIIRNSKRDKIRSFGTKLLESDRPNQNRVLIVKDNSNLYKEIDKLRNNNISKEDSRFIKKIVNSSNKDKYQIFHPQGSGTDQLSHEIGHIRTAERGNIIERFLNKKSNEPWIRNELNKGGNTKSRGLGETLKRYVSGKLVILDESKASKNALKVLKESGATEEQIKKAKENLMKDLNTYKFGIKVNYKTALLNTLKRRK